MSFYNYNPFQIDIRSLTGENLEVLRDVTEGWYVDYKEQELPIKKVSKHLASFANQYGGWLFFGIAESSERKAGKFPGIPRDSIEQVLLRIREASNAHVKPSIYYEEKVIHGPEESIGLKEGFAIIIIYIPEGANPPYIDSSGRIYRRLADQSYPVPETDHHVLNQLFQKSNKKWEKTKSFLRKRREVNNKNAPVVYIHLMTNLYFDKYTKPIEFDVFRDIFSGLDTTLGMSMPMNSVHSVQGGFIAKQTQGNDPLNHVTTVRWWNDGNAMIVIPLNKITYESISNINIDYVHAVPFLDELREKGMSHASVVDFSYFLIALSSLYNQLTEVYKATENDNRVYASVSLENAAKMVPFINDEEYLKEVRKNGAPIIEDSEIRIPENLDDRNFIRISSKESDEADVSQKNINSILKVASVFSNLFFSIGVINRTDDVVKFTSLFNLGRHTNELDK